MADKHPIVDYYNDPNEQQSRRTLRRWMMVCLWTGFILVCASLLTERWEIRHRQTIPRPSLQLPPNLVTFAAQLSITNKDLSAQFAAIHKETQAVSKQIAFSRRRTSAGATRAEDETLDAQTSAAMARVRADSLDYQKHSAAYQAASSQYLSQLSAYYAAISATSSQQAIAVGRHNQRMSLLMRFLTLGFMACSIATCVLIWLARPHRSWQRK